MEHTSLCVYLFLTIYTRKDTTVDTKINPYLQGLSLFF